MFTGMELMACRNLAAPAEAVQHIVNVESSANPYAIGVVGGQLVRQPQNLDEALATVHMLDAGGYNYSLGVAQVNRANLGKYGLDSYEEAFEPCSNVAAGARILAACYASSGGDWGKSFSCYYSGNFVTGYRDGYVAKVYDSINRTALSTTAPIVLQGQSQPPRGNARAMTTMAPTNSAYRVAMRSVRLDTATATLAPIAGSTPVRASVEAVPAQPQSHPLPTPPTLSVAPLARAPGISTAAATDNAVAAVFVPQVRGPDDPLSGSASANALRPQTNATAAPTGAAADQTDLRQENGDAAFVF